VGKYGNSAAAETCEQCSADTYLSILSATKREQCQVCPAFSNLPVGTGSVQQLECRRNAGYSGDPESGCVAYIAGKYNAGNRATPAVCSMCGAGKHNLAAAATSKNACALCEAGKYALQARSSCSCAQSTPFALRA